LDVQAGYENAYRTDEWFPVTIRVANNGPDLRGLIEWRFRDQITGEFQLEIDLPRGSSKQVTLYVYGDGFARSGEVRLLENGVERAKSEVRLDAVDIDQAVYAVVSDDSSLLNSLSSLVPTDFSSAVVKHIDLATLPEHTASLRSINALFLHNTDTSTLTEGQRTAIHLWVRLGGQLVISGGSNGQQTASGFADILPAEISPDFAQASLAPLNTVVPQASNQVDAQASVNVASPRPGTRALFGSADTPPLMFSRAFGAGTVIFTTFDIASLRGWNGEPQLWQRQISPRQFFAIGTNARQRQFSLLEEVLRLRSLTLPPLWTLFCLLTLYVLIVGPINYLVLRRLRRLEWAWATVPLIVIGFVASIYVVGTVLRGANAQLVQATVVQGFEGEQRALATSFTGLFSPGRTRYTLGFPPNTLVSGLRSFDDFDPSVPVTTSDTSVQVRDTLVDIGAIETILIESTSDLDIAVESSLQGNSSSIGGEIHNTSAVAIEDAIIVRNGVFQELGTIDPGERQQIALDQGTTGFPWSLSLPRVGSFDRQQLLTRFFSESSNNGGMDAEGVYLIGWRQAPIVPVQLGNQEVPPDAVTLYVLRLEAQ
jgi:hypothetical protein